MRTLRTYSAYMLLILFSCYYSSISLFSHAHIIDGCSIVHSHLGGENEHDHSEAQYAIIDILSQFQSENPTDYCHVEQPFHLTNDVCTEYHDAIHVVDVPDANLLRGPPTSMTANS